MRSDKLGARFADSILFDELMGLPRRECKLVGFRCHDASTAVSSSDSPGRFENGQIATHSGDRSVNFSRDLLKRGKFNELQELGDDLLTLFGLHLPRYWKILESFATFLLTPWRFLPECAHGSAK